jgi:hypothetical protein
VSIEHMAAVLHHSRAKGTHKLVLLGIANHEGDGGAYPAVDTLAKYANVTPRNVQKSIAWLVEHGELRVWLQDGDPRKPAHERTNRYAVLVACPAWCDRTPQHRDTRRRQVGDHPGLWRTRVSDATPPVGIDTPPLSLVTPGGVSDATPKPPLEPNPPLVRPVRHDRAREDSRPCQVCDQPSAKCVALQSAYPPADRHTYRARARHASG